MHRHHNTDVYFRTGPFRRYIHFPADVENVDVTLEAVSCHEVIPILYAVAIAPQDGV
jgi:hypothetical protein